MKSKRKPTRKARSKKSIADLIGHHRGRVAQFARDLSKISGRKATWSMVNNWKLRNRVARNWVLHVHKLTGARLEDLLR